MGEIEIFLLNVTFPEVKIQRHVLKFLSIKNSGFYEYHSEHSNFENLFINIG